MHPIEHLRWVARSAGAPQQALVAETARALSGFAGDELGLVTACRRVVHRHPTCGSLLWLAARAVTSPDPRAELRESAAMVAADPTSRHVADTLAPEATVVVVGWPEVGVASLGRRGDLSVVVVDTDGSGEDLVDALGDADVQAQSVDPVALGAVLGALASSRAGARSGDPDAVVVLVEADLVDAARAIAAPGSLAAVATARALGMSTWLVAPRGRTMPGVMVDAALDRLSAGAPRATDVDWDVVPTALLDAVVRPDGVLAVAEALAFPDCASVPELFAGDVF